MNTRQLSFCRETSPSERGSILVLAALLLFVVVLFVAMVIDTARLTSASRQKAQSADFVAQSFLQGYTSSLSTATEEFSPEVQQAAYQFGLETATRTGRLNYSTANQATSYNNDASRQLTQPSDLFRDNYNNPGQRGHVQMGLWFYEKPKDLDGVCSASYTIDDKDPANRCPCITEDPTRPFGCFVACDNINGCRDPRDPGGAGARVPPNAARVTLTTDNDSSDGSTTRVQNMFGAVTGIAESEVSNTGISVMIPRRSVVLLDLGRSTTAETHYQWQKNVNIATDQSSEYAYRCVDQVCTTSTDSRGPFGQCGQPDTTSYETAYGIDKIDKNPPVPAFTLDPKEQPLNVSGFNDGYRQSFRLLEPRLAVWNSPSPTKLFPLGTRPLPFCPQANRQCKRQYQCAAVDTDGDNIAESTETFIVDNGFYEDGVPKAAQPHTNMLAATNTLLSRLYERRVAGDMIGFIGFGQTVDTTRDPNVPAANRFRKTNRYIPPASVLKSNQRSWDSWADATDFQKIFDFTDPDPGRRVWRAQHNIFPRPEEFADLPLALWHAHNMLMQIPGAESAQNSIFIVTSGLTHCRRDNSNDKELPFGKGPVCGRGFDAHQASLKEVLDYRIAGSADWRLATDKIPLHTIFVGSKVAPHTIAVHKFGSNPPVCLTEKELRQRNLYTTLPATTSHEETSASYDSVGKGSVQQGDHSLNYYQSAHWLSAAARQVGGLWIPIRMDTVNCGWSVGCADNTLLPEINSACAMKPMPYGPNPATGKYPNPSYPADIFPGATVKFNVKGDSWLNSTTPPNSVPADSEGRIFCDVNCNETRGIDGVSNQIDSALGEMYRLPPISLVDEP